MNNKIYTLEILVSIINNHPTFISYHIYIFSCLSLKDFFQTKPIIRNLYNIKLILKNRTLKINICCSVNYIKNYYYSDKFRNIQNIRSHSIIIVEIFRSKTRKKYK